MEHKHSGESSNNYQESILPIQYNELLKQNEPIRNKYVEFCSKRYILPVFMFDEKQLHLWGTIQLIKEAGKILILLGIG